MSRDVTALAPVPAEGRIWYGRHSTQFLDFWRPVGTPRGTAVMVHGGFWRAQYDLTHASHLCAALAAAGVTVVNLEYRRLHSEGGGWPGSFEDVQEGVEAARVHFGAEPAVLGHSAGGHLALRLASTAAAIRGVVALAPVADLGLAHELNLSNGAVQEFLGADPAKNPELLADADPTQHAASVRVIIVHGTDDSIVSLRLSRRYFEARRNDPVPPQLIAVEGADHFDVIDPESNAFTVVRECVLKLL